MARTNTYVDEWLSYWERMNRQFSERLQRSANDARSGQYGWERAFSDQAAMWWDSVDAWWSFFARRPAAGTPMVFFRITAGTESKMDGDPIPLPGSRVPTHTDLVCLGNPRAIIPKDHVRIERTEGGDAIVIKLVNLGKLKMSPGQYVGMVYDNDAPVAVMHAVVTA